MRYLIVVAMLVLASCTTFETKRVTEGGSTDGFPFVFQQSYIARVTYQDDTQAFAAVELPTLYAVDINHAPLGTTEAKISNTEAGFPKDASADIDQKTVENLTALTELLKVLGAGGAIDPSFLGDTLVEEEEVDRSLAAQIGHLLVNKTVKSVELIPINQPS